MAPGCAVGTPRFAALKRKPLHVLLAEEEKGQLHRTLSLFDLTAIGIGGTVGSGVFTLVGSVAVNDAGPGVLLSLLIGTFGCLLTCNAYIKLSRAIPSTGSVYAYTYHCLGEAFAVIAASCLTLEYALSGSAVATSWGQKLAAEFDAPWLAALVIPGINLKVNLGAALVCIPCISILLVGLSAGKLFTNVITVVKCLIVAFMITVSISKFRSDNLSPLIPERQFKNGADRYGIDGLFKGAVDCFFAFIGFDEVCCLAGEARNPKRDLPWSVALSVAGTAALTFLAALGLVGMQSYATMNPEDAGFAAGFRSVHLNWAAEIAAWGELITLPVVVFISFLPQARLFYAMAMDGLLPLCFTRLTSQGVLFWSNAGIGTVCTLLAMVVNFDVFNDMISAGVLLSFILCNCSLITLSLKTLAPPRANGDGVQLEPEAEDAVGIGRPLSPAPATASLQVVNPPQDEEEDEGMFTYIGRVLTAFCILTFLSMVLLSGVLLESTFAGQLGSASAAVQIVALLFAVIFGCGALVCVAILDSRPHDPELGGVWIPVLAIIFNCFMLATLSLQGFLIIAGYFVFALVVYFGYGIRHSAGNQSRWERASLILRNGSGSSRDGSLQPF